MRYFVPTKVRDLAVWPSVTVVLCLRFCSPVQAAGAQLRYDSLDRLTNVQQSNGTTIDYSYDAAGNRTQRVVSVPKPPNQPPEANAGAGRTVRLGSLVTLDGSVSSDPDNGPSSLTFSWSQSSGPTAALSGTNAAKPTFTPRAAGDYVFVLKIYDGQAWSQPSTVTITVPILGDIDGDGDVDITDVGLITAARDTPASGPNDLRDLDGDGTITALDAREAVLLCTRPRCAMQ